MIWCTALWMDDVYALVSSIHCITTSCFWSFWSSEYCHDHIVLIIKLCRIAWRHVKKLVGKQFQKVAISNVSKLSSVKALVQMSSNFCILRSNHHSTYTHNNICYQHLFDISVNFIFSHLLIFLVKTIADKLETRGKNWNAFLNLI